MFWSIIFITNIGVLKTEKKRVLEDETNLGNIFWLIPREIMQRVHLQFNEKQRHTELYLTMLHLLMDVRMNQDC